MILQSLLSDTTITRLILNLYQIITDYMKAKSISAIAHCKTFITKEYIERYITFAKSCNMGIVM